MSDIERILDLLKQTVELVKTVCRPTECGVRAIIGPFSTGKVEFSMGNVTAPNGATGTLKLVTVPDGAPFTGTPKWVSSDVAVVTVVDNGDSTGTFALVGTNGQTASITGSDDAFSDPIGVTVQAAVITETGVVATATLNP